MTPNISDIMRAVELIRSSPPNAIIATRELIDNFQPLIQSRAPSLFGMRVFQSPLAKAPARKHKKRAWMSANYHKRIQKKWNKRFGFVQCAYVFNADYLNTLDIRHVVRIEA